MRKGPFFVAFAPLLSLAACGGNSPANGPTSSNGLPLPPPRPPSANIPDDGHVIRFVNGIRNARSNALRQHYADFTFEFPSNWVITAQPTDGSALNYVGVSDYPIDGYAPVEVNVGYVYGTGRTETDQAELGRNVARFAREFGARDQNYRVTYAGPQRLGRYRTIGWRWESTAPGRNGGRPARLFGRTDLILPPGARNGVSVTTVVTDRSGEAGRQASTGETEITHAIYESLRIGPDEAGPSPSGSASDR